MAMMDNIEFNVSQTNVYAVPMILAATISGAIWTETACLIVFVSDKITVIGNSSSDISGIANQIFRSTLEFSNANITVVANADNVSGCSGFGTNNLISFDSVNLYINTTTAFNVSGFLGYFAFFIETNFTKVNIVF
jgi:hypothetical protein